ncbi:hypothetical protein [Phenylobacterium sp. RIFCSPHIGHO2_01_FULL_69_31]|uniref:hypothetical protein n=1 Tax=Phenylobacterium sp. RIFCSPHIGHO2_01_FULL_69_31 TaxID=1801944 RepID=UPI0025E2E2E9|nr:hypothetical protein [Phenylobacterium sp. RIFCSPHIGHO2_01_FULL_69_31]
MKKIAAGLFLLATCVAAQAAAQEWSNWERFRTVDSVNIDYRIKPDGDGFRVAWRCVNVSSRRISCSVGAGENKSYGCYRGSTKVGSTEALGERAGVRGGGSYEFPSEPACRGFKATSVRPFAEIAIEDE